MNDGTHRIPKVRRPVRRRDLAFWAAVVVGAIALGFGIYQAGLWRAQKDALVTALTQQRQQAQDAGLTPVAPPPKKILDDPGVVAGPKGDQGEPGPAGPGPTDAQVRAAIDAYFRQHPVANGRPPTPTEIAAAVVNYLTAHPPSPGPVGPSGPAGAEGDRGDAGPGPTAEQVAAAVEDYLTEHPPPSGPAGPAGPGPTAEQIADAVEEYIDSHGGLPMCPTGTTAQAVTVLATDGPKDIVACVKDAAG